MISLCSCNGLLSADPQFLLGIALPRITGLHFSHPSSRKMCNSLMINPKNHEIHQRRLEVMSCAGEGEVTASTMEIDMVRSKDGVYTAAQQKVMVVWDIDNKPPTLQPFNSATALKGVAELFGSVVDMSAYADKETFGSISDLVIGQNSEELSNGSHSGAFECKLCGKTWKTQVDLKKHFVGIHEREKEKRMKRMKSLKGKKRERYKEKIFNTARKFDSAVSHMFEHNANGGLEMELRRAGVRVRKVRHKRQASEKVLMKNLRMPIDRRVSFLLLVSDDHRFSDILTRAKISNLGTVVVGKREKSLDRYADYWVSWDSVEKGKVLQNDLKRITHVNDEFFDGDCDSDYGTQLIRSYSDDDDDELGQCRIEINGSKISAFYEEDGEDFEDEEYYESDMFWESGDEDDEAEEIWFV